MVRKVNAASGVGAVSKAHKVHGGLQIPFLSEPSLHSTYPPAAQRTKDGTTSPTEPGASLPEWDATQISTDTEIQWRLSYGDKWEAIVRTN